MDLDFVCSSLYYLQINVTELALRIWNLLSFVCSVVRFDVTGKVKVDLLTIGLVLDVKWRKSEEICTRYHQYQKFVKLDFCYLMCPKSYKPNIFYFIKEHHMTVHVITTNNAKAACAACTQHKQAGGRKHNPNKQLSIIYLSSNHNNSWQSKH